MKKTKLIDLWILIPYIILLGIGIVMVYSASFYNNMMVGGSTTQYLIKQALYAIVGLGLCLLAYQVKTQILKSPGIITIFGLLTLLSLMWLALMGFVHPSTRVNGASAWINIGFINFQPLELAKLVVVLYLAYILSNKQQKLTETSTFKDLLKDNVQPLAILILIIGFVIIQPDFGGALILSILCIVLISASKIPSKYIRRIDGTIFISIGLVVFALFKFKPHFFTDGYQYQRFLAVFHPFQLEQKAGNQLVNSFYAISNGGVLGTGLGNSIQKRGYLPEPHTDFILSIISEELGVLGVLVILGLLACIVFRILLIGLRSKNEYTSLVMYGVATILMTQIILNVGGLLGYLPLTGVTLPFISYGGSSMIILSVALGIAMNLEATDKYESIKLR